jgi:hypothetical protein
MKTRKNTPAEMAKWKRTPKEYRGTTNGVRMVLHMNRKTGATESWPLDLAHADDLLFAFGGYEKNQN